MWDDKRKAVSKPKSIGRRKPPKANVAKGVGNAYTSPAQIRLQERRAEALELRRQGYSFPQIAKAMKVSQSTAFGYVDEALKAITKEPAQQLLLLELQRLDLMQQAIFARAAAGHIKSIETMLKIMERRARLEGLDKAKDGVSTTNVMNLVVPPKIEVHFPDGAKVINGEVAAPR